MMKRSLQFWKETSIIRRQLSGDSQTCLTHCPSGMSHRGRLNVLANICRKPLEQIFAQFAALEVADEVREGGRERAIETVSERGRKGGSEGASLPFRHTRDACVEPGPTLSRASAANRQT